ncbi:hypothetical protein D3C71_1668450 [compost metagenome]
MTQRIFDADPASAFADHHAQCRARLQALAVRVNHHAVVAIAGVGRLDEQHGFERWFLVRRLLEFGDTLVQQPLIVQRNAEQGAVRNIMQGTAHAFLLAVAGQRMTAPWDIH